MSRTSIRGTVEFVVRRLYSTFAGGWPGTGLLLLRVVSGATLLVCASQNLTGAAPAHATLTAALLVVSGLLIIPGLWTPLVGTLVALLEICQILTRAGDPHVSLLVGTMAGALAMLGPGLWSVDARLFGWKRVDAPPRRIHPGVN